MPSENNFSQKRPTPAIPQFQNYLEKTFHKSDHTSQDPTLTYTKSWSSDDWVMLEPSHGGSSFLPGQIETKNRINEPQSTGGELLPVGIYQF